MTPERFARIDALFNAALDLPPTQRHAFLDRECTGDPELPDVAHLRIAMHKTIVLDEFIGGAGAAARSQITGRGAQHEWIGPQQFALECAVDESKSAYHHVAIVDEIVHVARTH